MVMDWFIYWARHGSRFCFFLFDYCGSVLWVYAGGMSLYFASQGTGVMVLPVLVNIARLLIVSIVCTLVAVFQLEIKWLFCGVSIGLLVTGVGQFLCLYSSPWKRAIWSILTYYFLVLLQLLCINFTLCHFASFSANTYADISGKLEKGVYRNPL